MSDPTDDIKQTVQAQFGPNAAKYATSRVHAKGASLARLVELTQPQPDWQMLDVASAAGHTAFVFAPHVAHVVATDLTAEMLTVAQNLAAEKGLTNVSFERADAEDLPFDDDRFDLVTCRIAPHHFPHVDRFVAEAARVLKPGGLLAVVDNISPGTPLRGKKARAINAAGDYYNAFEKLRDPSHVRALPLHEWQRLLISAEFELLIVESHAKWMAFDPWATRLGLADDDLTRLRAMLLQAPEKVQEFLTPQQSGAKIDFRLTEAILIGKLGESGD